MGVREIDKLVEDHADHHDLAAEKQAEADAKAAYHRESVAKSDAEHVANDREIISSRGEVEQKFAVEREDIEAKYLAKVARADEQRQNAHKRNLEQRQESLGKVGLNPNGSDPAGRPQAIYDRKSGTVVEASVR